MSLTRRLRTLVCCTILELGTLIGVPMRAEQIQDLMRALNTSKIAHTTPEEANRDDGSAPRE
jgi:hypothetical protein